MYCTYLFTYLFTASSTAVTLPQNAHVELVRATIIIIGPKYKHTLGGSLGAEEPPPPPYSTHTNNHV